MSEESSKYNLLVLCSGSCATVRDWTLYKAQEATKLFNIEFVYSKAAEYFSVLLNLKESDLNEEGCPPMPKVWKDEDEWKWSKDGDPVVHIDLRKWADLYLVAPLSCNTMAKIANGLSDNLLTCILRNCDLNTVYDINDMVLDSKKMLKKPIILCPAMNTMMYYNPFTTMQFNLLKSFGFVIIDCIVSTLACGDVAKGCMEKVDKIADKCKYIAETYCKREGKVTSADEDTMDDGELSPILVGLQGRKNKETIDKNIDHPQEYSNWIYNTEKGNIDLKIDLNLELSTNENTHKTSLSTSEEDKDGDELIDNTSVGSGNASFKKEKWLPTKLICKDILKSTEEVF